MFNAEDFPSYPPSAPAALAAQIEEMNPSAVKLEVAGFRFQVAQYLAQATAAGSADISELRSHALGSAAAVAICEAISKRHARKAAAVAALRPPPAPKPAPVAAKPDGMDSMSALSALHTLFQEAERGQSACLTTLMNSGWSESTSRELVKVINASLANQRKVK